MRKYCSGSIIKNEVDHLDYREGAGDTMEIFDIAVNSSPRTGIGSQMIRELIGMFSDKKVFAITHSANTNAQKFYEKNGFVGTRLPNFYPVFQPYTTGDAIMYIYENNKEL